MKKIRIYGIIPLAALFLMPNLGVAQDEEGCPEVTDKKTVKYFQIGTDKKKYRKQERVDALRKAIDLEPDYMDARFALAQELIKTARVNGTSYKGAEKHLMHIVNNCPEFHYEPYYLLGAIALGRNEYTPAVKYYEKYFAMTAEQEVYTDDEDKEYIEARLDYEYAKFFHDAFANPVPFDPKPVPNVASKDDEYLPLISPDNEMMLYTRRYTKKGPSMGTSVTSDKQTFFERFTRSYYRDGKFVPGESLPFPFNEKDGENYGGATVSVDNKHIYLTICKPAVRKVSYTKFMNCDLYVSDYVFAFNEQTGREEWHWTPLKNMGPNINTPEGWEAQPSLSGDGQTLYFASAREGSKGIDIYKSERDANGEWAPCQALNETINTEYNEKTPFIHSDSETLYFSSDGHLGFGGYDVFYARKDDNKQWEKPKNIGHPINTKNDEHGFIVSTDGKQVYFGSDAVGGTLGGLDILSFRLYKEARPEEVVLLKGKITDNKGNTIKESRIEVKNMKTNEVTTIKVDENDGNYAAVVTVKKDEDLVVNVKAEGKAFKARLITARDTELEEEDDVNALDNSETVLKLDAELEEVEVGKPYRLNDIYYKTNSAELNEKSLFILDQFMEFLKENPNMRVGIYGHTDNVGSPSDNLALSTDRAFSVMAYLQEKGLSAKRLTFKGYGEEKPVASNATDEGRAKNRRTEFVILSK